MHKTSLKMGDVAPAFSMKDFRGEIISLQDFKGKKLALCFYPTNETPPCTAGVCSLRDGYEALQNAGIEVLGVSPDHAESHIEFGKKYHLPFRLVPDTELALTKAYDVWGLKKLGGREFDGVIRTTFIIDEAGRIERIIKSVKTKDHANQILDVLAK